MEGHYSDTVQLFHNNYTRNARAVGVVWGIFTVCFAIINIVVFVQPQWIGGTASSPGVGHFGLYEHCESYHAGSAAICSGTFTDMDSILNTAFAVSTVFVGVSAIIQLLVVLCMLLFFCLSTRTVYTLCAVMQLFSGVFMVVGCTVYGGGWDNASVQRVCGPGAGMFSLGECGMRWAYILAIVGIFDALVLGVLALVLARRQAKSLPEYFLHNGGGGLKPGEVNGGYITDVDSLSKAGTMQPVLMVPDTLDRRSEYSQHSAKRSHREFAL